MFVFLALTLVGAFHGLEDEFDPVIEDSCLLHLRGHTEALTVAEEAWIPLGAGGARGYFNPTTGVVKEELEEEDLVTAPALIQEVHPSAAAVAQTSKGNKHKHAHKHHHRHDVDDGVAADPEDGQAAGEEIPLRSNEADRAQEKGPAAEGDGDGKPAPRGGDGLATTTPAPVKPVKRKPARTTPAPEDDTTAAPQDETTAAPKNETTAAPEDDTTAAPTTTTTTTEATTAGPPESHDMNGTYTGKPGEDACIPRCDWRCEESACASACTPHCEQPECEARCGKTSHDNCTVSCDNPHCTVFCPADVCNGTETCKHPRCKTRCDPPKCLLHCAQAAPCENVCSEPRCTWSCEANTTCQVPLCNLVCHTPKECKEVHYKLPKLREGHSVAARFRATFDQYDVGPWSRCSSLCGAGVQKRAVSCQGKHCGGEAPAAERECVGSECGPKCEVEVFREAEFQGWRVVLLPGGYGAEELKTQEGGAGEFSSLKVSGPCCHARLTDNPDLDSAAGEWTAEFGPGGYDTPALGDAGVVANRTGSVYVFNDAKCVKELRHRDVPGWLWSTAVVLAVVGLAAAISYAVWRA